MLPRAARNARARSRGTRAPRRLHHRSRALRTRFLAYTAHPYSGIPLDAYASEDGIDWRFTGGRIDDATAPAVLFDGSSYRMWFTSGSDDLRLATSGDGIDWTVHPDPIAIQSRSPVAVLADEGDTLRMWFSGTAEPYGEPAIGYATCSGC